MKVTYLIPPVLDGTRDVDRCFGCSYNIYFLPLLPVLSSATILKNEGVTVSIMDFPAQKKNKKAFEAFIKNDDSDFYILYTVFLCQETDLLARAMIREIRPRARFIFAGPQPTFSPEVFLDGEDTFVARSEPEFVIKDIIKVAEANLSLDGVKGLSYYKGSQIINNSPAPLIIDLDQIPISDRRLLEHKPYSNPKLCTKPHTAIMTSRGCFGRCWFCVPNSLSYARELEYKKYYCKKPPPCLYSAERVIEEFSNIARLGFRSVSIIDDEFLWDDERTLQICYGIKGLGLEWSCLARPDKINEKVAKAMADAGCAYVDLGAESFDEDVLKSMRKDLLPQDTQKAVEILKKFHIKIELNVLFGGTPKETEATMKGTFKALKKLNVDYVLFSIANPFPGTDFYYAAKKEGWMCYGDYIPVDPSKNAIIGYPHLSKEKLERFISYAYLAYYLNVRYLLKQLLNVKSIGDLSNKFFTAIKFFIKNFHSHLGH